MPERVEEAGLQHVELQGPACRLQQAGAALGSGRGGEGAWCASREAVLF